MVAETKTARQRQGRFGNMVRLNILILAAQDAEVDRLVGELGQRKSSFVRDALARHIGYFKELEVPRCNG